MAEGGEGLEEEERSCASGFGIGGDDGAGCSGSSAPAARMRSGGGTEQPPPPPPFSDQVLENVLESVLEFLTCRRDRNAASLVCRSWYRAEAQTRREVFIGNCYAVSPVRAVERFRSARAMVLKGRPRFDDFSLVPPGWGARFSPWATAMAAAYPWFERVCLKRITVSDADLALLARSFPFFTAFLPQVDSGRRKGLGGVSSLLKVIIR